MTPWLELGKNLKGPRVLFQRVEQGVDKVKARLDSIVRPCLKIKKIK